MSAHSKRAQLVRQAQGHEDEPQPPAPKLSRQHTLTGRPGQLSSRSVLEELLFEVSGSEANCSLPLLARPKIVPPPRSSSTPHPRPCQVSAGLGCSRLHWLTVLYEKQSVALHNLAEPLAVSRDPDANLAAAGLPPDLTFKPSRLKNSQPLAYLACNCHTQQLFVDAHTSGPITHSASAAAVASSQDQDAPPFIGGRYDLVTCGCPSAHMIKSPGLVQLEAKIAKADDRLDAEGRRLRRSKRQDSGGSDVQPGSPTRVVQLAVSEESEESERLRRKREWLLFQRSQRLPVCVSQALGAITTLLHASIVRALAHAPSDLKQWAACGFLVG